MKHIRCRNAVVLLAGVMGVGAAQAQTVKAQEGAKAATPIPAITDWSSRSVVYNNPKMPDEFARTAAGDAEMARLYRDPRYTAQVLRRLDSEMARSTPQRTTLTASAGKAGAVQGVTCSDSDRRRGHCDDTPAPSSTSSGGVLRDWSNVLGGGTNGLGGSGANGVFPAKYNFNITATPSCANDFLVYPTNAAGATSSGSAETRTITFSERPDNGDTVVIGTAGTPRSVTLTAVGTATTADQFARGPNTSAATEATTNATNLAAAVNRFSGQTGISATSNAGVVTLSRNSGGNSTSIPVDVSDLSNATSPGTAVTNGSGAPGQPTIIAFNQLYQGTGTATASGPCNGSWNQSGATKAPNVMWSYNTGDGYVVETSPVLSYFDDGKQVAFIQRNANTLQLVLLKWKAGEGTAGVPVTPPLAASAADYRNSAGNCTTTSSCMFKITFSGTSNTDSAATYSSPYVDYVNNNLWVGDGNGRLHKFTGVFQGSPAEEGGNFPAQVIDGATNGIKLSPPVEVDGQVYVGSQSGGEGIGGKVHRVDATSGAVVSSAKLANNNSTGFRESLIATFAPTATGGSVFAFLFNDGSGGNGSTCVTTQSSNACRIVARFNPGFAADAAPVERAYVGRGNSTVSTLYAGSFDNAFYTSTNGTGAMYIVGGAYNDTFTPTLWKIPLTNGVMQTPVAGRVVGSNDCNTVGDCLTNNWDWSPVTAFMNGTTEYLYFSMGKKGNATGCTGACIYMFQLNNLDGDATPNETGDSTWATTNVPRAALAAPGGTGGIMIDNSSGTTGSSQIYFTQVQAGGNAVQASQSGLQ